MRLQRLEISGFKSFPERADLAFDRGVTAIVGPNGCGKSNVVDAIAWVLGEQSARSLRGDRMEDVIFSGSEARKPTAAAEVRLRFTGVTARLAVSSNGDEVLDELEEGTVRAAAREVELSRRLYRSGESEYLIDGHVCRLRDVQDLLMDSGVGLKGYAVIEQGKIGQILTARPTDRRQLIEEAAGVTKYKARRRAAELKLEAAQQNLTRIDDIVHELERQRGSLKRQAAKAGRYRRLRDELRRWEKVQFARRYRSLAEGAERNQLELEAARGIEVRSAARVAELDAHVAALRIELAEAESRATTHREHAHARELETGRRQQQIEFDTTQIATLTERATVARAEIDGLDARRAPAQADLEARVAAAGDANRDRDAAARALADEEGALALALQAVRDAEDALESVRSQVLRGLSATTALQHTVERAEEARERIAQELGRLDVEGHDVRTELERCGAERGRIATSLHEQQTALETLQAERAARESELASARIESEWRQNEMRARERDLAAAQARLTSLEELEATRTEYGDAARVLLAEPAEGGTHYGAVADHLEVEVGYERAVEASVGDLLQYIVVETSAMAERALEVVRSRQVGRCGFLVLDGTTANRPDSRELPAGAQALGRVVRATGPWAGQIGPFVSRGVIADSFEQAVALSMTTDVPVVTRDGTVVRGGRLIAGGAREQARGILETKRQIRDLRVRLAEDHATVERLASEIGAHEAAMSEIAGIVGGLDFRRQETEKNIHGLDLQLLQSVEDLRRLERRGDLIAAERRRAREELGALVSRQDEARESIAQLDAEQRAADGRLVAGRQRLADDRELMAAAASRVAEAKARHATLVERATAVASDVGRLEDAQRDLEDRIGTRRAELVAIDDHLGSLRAAVIENRRLLDEDVRALAALREAVAEAESSVADLQAAFEARDAATRDARRELDDHRAAVGQLEIARATAEADLSHLAEACRETVQTSLEEVDAEVARLESEGALTPDPAFLRESATEDDEDEADGEAAADEPEAGVPAVSGVAAAVEAAPAAAVLTADAMIAGLKRRLERLGAVNMMAIEQFEELETRHQFLVTQRQDLVDSIAATDEAIRRIDKTTRVRFKEAFDAVNLHFQETFGTLFGGGRAGLVLLDEDDPVDSGIDIIAQPPGKRLQSVQLLSGGEKALTAMALMFAIFRFRPSPFCLLDEIDAPLDDANVARFVAMLQGMQDETQFILITHHRRTMEIADRLYGVTMEEPGVSKLISLQLN